MHYFVTGHTGFKGAWLTLILRELGHEVSGYSLAPHPGSLFTEAGLESELRNHYEADIRNLSDLTAAVMDSQPDVAIHMAAQPLVLQSYSAPKETFDTNVTGTLNFLESLRALGTPPSTLVVTTDKVYKDTGSEHYAESAPLGGLDPYSASKSMADLLTQSWAHTHPEYSIHIARAGNVIGPMDISPWRLIPDIGEASRTGGTLELRHPDAVRPWQHVFDCLLGYLLFTNQITRGEKLPIALNFGPDETDLKTVKDVVEIARSVTPFFHVKTADNQAARKETKYLSLDSKLARSSLGWDSILSFEESVIDSLDRPGLESALPWARNKVKRFLERASALGLL